MQATTTSPKQPETPAFPFYQSHEGVTGMSDSGRKWQRLRVPADLTGKRVLDIGSNEGLVTSWCAKNGAEQVIGIDFDRPRVAYAQERYGSDKLEFRHQTWASLPEGQFGLVLWTSAMHYEKDPKSVLTNIHRRLEPNGLLILECGFVSAPGREMVTVSRHSDTTLYPTIDYLTEVLLSEFSVRQVTEAEVTPGDPIPRAVFHCRPRLPTVLFVIGRTGAGKTGLVSAHLGRTADKVLRLDMLVSRVAQGQYVHGPLQEAIKANYNPDNLGPIYSAIQSEPLRDSFLNWLAQLCARSDGLVVIEGDLTAETVGLFSGQNLDRRVWVVSKL
jgi:SAM-dependent methyltransferase